VTYPVRGDCPRVVGAELQKKPIPFTSGDEHNEPVLSALAVVVQRESKPRNGGGAFDGKENEEEEDRQDPNGKSTHVSSRRSRCFRAGSHLLGGEHRERLTKIIVLPMKMSGSQPNFGLLNRPRSLTTGIGLERGKEFVKGQLDHRHYQKMGPLIVVTAAYKDAKKMPTGQGALATAAREAAYQSLLDNEYHTLLGGATALENFHGAHTVRRDQAILKSASRQRERVAGMERAVMARAAAERAWAHAQTSSGDAQAKNQHEAMQKLSDAHAAHSAFADNERGLGAYNRARGRLEADVRNNYDTWAGEWKRERAVDIKPTKEIGKISAL
jgi:hypothetical protein